MSRAARTLLLAIVLALGRPPPARRTPRPGREIPSGTTEEITAVEYRGGDQFWFTTANGKIFRRVGGTFQQELQPAGRRVPRHRVRRRRQRRPRGRHERSGRPHRPTAAPTGPPVALPQSGNPAERVRSATHVKHAARRPRHGRHRRRRPRLDRRLRRAALALDRHGRRAGHGLGGRQRRLRGRLQPARATSTACSSSPGSEVRLLHRQVVRPGVLRPSNGLAGAASPEAAASAGNGFDQSAPPRRRPGEPEPHVGRRSRATAPSYVRRTTDGWNSELDWELANRDRREITDRPTTSTTRAARSSRPVRRA